jgi:hypothetical protein
MILYMPILTDCKHDVVVLPPSHLSALWALSDRTKAALITSIYSQTRSCRGAELVYSLINGKERMINPPLHILEIVLKGILISLILICSIIYQSYNPTYQRIVLLCVIGPCVGMLAWITYLIVIFVRAKQRCERVLKGVPGIIHGDDEVYKKYHWFWGDFGNFIFHINVRTHIHTQIHECTYRLNTHTHTTGLSTIPTQMCGLEPSYRSCNTSTYLSPLHERSTCGSQRCETYS